MEKNILKIETRKKIYNIISKNPGLHLQEIQRRSKIPITTIRYHLHFLKKNNLISEKDENHYKRYHAVNKIGCKDKQIISLLRNKSIRAILYIIFLEVTSTRSSISNWLDLPPTTIGYYLKKLEELDIIEHPEVCNEGMKSPFGKNIEHRPVKNEKFYRYKDIYFIWDILITYQDSFKDDFTKEMLWLLSIKEKDLPKKYKVLDIDTHLNNALKLVLDFLPMPFCA